MGMGARSYRLEAADKLANRGRRSAEEGPPEEKPDRRKRRTALIVEQLVDAEAVRIAAPASGHTAGTLVGPIRTLARRISFADRQVQRDRKRAVAGELYVLKLHVGQFDLPQEAPTADRSHGLWVQRRAGTRSLPLWVRTPCSFILDLLLRCDGSKSRSTKRLTGVSSPFFP